MQGERPEHLALAKHACAACGAQAEWHPASSRLVCGFCGTESRYEIRADGTIRENDLAQALRELPDESRGWQADRRSVRCRSCRAVSVFEVGRVGQNCEFCGSPKLVDYDEVKAPIRPESLLPFKIDRVAARERLRQWIRGRWFAPGRLARGALVDTVRGLYVPYWTFDAQVHCRWTADSGTYYYTTETYRDSKGQTRTRQVRHVSWRPAAGEIDHFFDDQPVPGTVGLDRGLLTGIEPFPTGDLVPYDTAYLSGFVVEHYQIVLVDAAEDARQAMEGTLRQLCAAQVPGDTHRNLQIDPTYSGRTFKHILVPVWLLRYDWGRTAWQVLVNGYTGRVTGRYPRSAWKIAGLVVTIVAVVGIIVAIAR